MTRYVKAFSNHRSIKPELQRAKLILNKVLRVMGTGSCSYDVDDVFLGAKVKILPAQNAHFLFSSFLAPLHLPAAANSASN